MPRRNFTKKQKQQIVERATVDRVVYCEGCGVALKQGAWEIDHIIAEGLRPEADKQRPITIAEGQLLGKCCHRGPDGKTNKDVKAIAKSNRQFAGHNGIRTRPVAKIKSAGFVPSERTAARQSKDLPPLPYRALYAPKERP
jgi:hypothetical protein